jgi:hypothetical protein
MDSLTSFETRLHDATAAVEKEIESCNQQLEVLNNRLEGLRRAAELFESEQAAMAELLRAGTPNGGVISAEFSTAPVAKTHRPTAASHLTNGQKQRPADTQSGSKSPGRRAIRTGGRNGGLTRVEMIAGVLKRHPRRTVRELIALLAKEHRWKTTESAVTGHLYTHRDKFVHTPPDRANNRPVTWSSK